MTYYSNDEVARMEAAFHLVADPNDWRNEIDAVVRIDRLVDVANAIQFYTATRAVVTQLDNHTARVQSVGYRAGPAGP